jgi:hypothetical protein
MAEFAYQDLLPLGEDVTPYRLLTRKGVSTLEAGGRRFLEVDPAALTELSRAAMRDIAHLFRTGHLQQLADILRDPEASPNDRFVALELLKNACVAAGGVLPSCQDTGTATVMGKKGERVLTGGGDEAAIARGVFDAYRTSRAVTDACRRHGGFYLGSIGGPAARLAQDFIRKVEVLEYPELGMEAVWRIEVEDSPAFVVVDDKGNDFFARLGVTAKD